MKGDYTNYYLDKLQEWRGYNSDQWVELIKKYPELGDDAVLAYGMSEKVREEEAWRLYGEARSKASSDPEESRNLYRRSRIWNLGADLSNLVGAIRDAQERGIRFRRRESE